MTLRDARIAVTGSSGFIGRHLVRRCEELGADVATWHRSASKQPSQSNERHVIDWTDTNSIAVALKRQSPDIIFHLGGFVSGSRSLSAMRSAFDGNVLATGNLLLTCCEVLPSARIVVATSLDSTDPWDSPSVTGSPYGVSKLMVEILTGGLRRLNDANAVAARIGFVYGPDDPNITRLVPHTTMALLGNQSPRLSSGTRKCDWVHAADVVDGLIALALAENIARDSFDLGTGVLSSVRTVAETIRDLVGTDTPVTYDHRLDRLHEQERAADEATTFDGIGWRAQRDLRTGLAETVAWHRHQLSASPNQISPQQAAMAHPAP